MTLTLESVSKTVGREVYIENADLTFETGSKNVILGRTLAGKTTLLRLMAGLDKPTTGRILVNGEDVTGMAVRKRKVAMVYQQFINYPSMTVFDNIASPLKLSRMDKETIKKRVYETAEILHLVPLLDRLPAELSGGQQQRTAIARSLVKDAQLLLLDEPLVNLDYKLREELRIELQQIFQRREAVVVYTTTEPAEALMLGGNIVVIHQGRILQTGPTPEVYHSPATTKVAEVFSDPPINYIDGTINGNRGTIAKDISIPLTGHLEGIAPGDYRFGVRSNHLFLQPQGSADTEIKATVELSEISGSETFIHVRHAQTPLVVQESGVKSRRIGEKVSVFVHPERLYVYDLAGDLIASPAGPDPAGGAGERGEIPQNRGCDLRLRPSGAALCL